MIIKRITISGFYLINYIILIKCSVQIDVPSKSINKVITTITTTTTSTGIANTTTPSITKSTTTTQSNSTTILPPLASTIQSASIPTTPLPTEINNSTVHNNNNNETINIGSSTEINELSWRKSRRQHIPENYYCHCDLKINYCDINCCCDIDCSTDERKTFICRENHWSLYDYDHFSGLQSCQIQNSLFCVVHDDTTIEQIVDYSLKNQYKYKWPQMFQSQRNDDDDHHDNDNNREYYKSGDSLLVYDEINEKIQTFDLPYSLTNDNCQISIPIQHLSDNFQTNCLRTIENLDKFLNDFQQKLINLKFLTSRKQKIMENCINCIHIKMYNCKNIISTKSCAEVIGTFNESRSINELELDTTDYSFINTKILINFNHNFTNILNCSIYFLYQNFTITTDFDFDNLETNINNNNIIIHKIIVKFFEQNETIIDYINNKFHNQISGNIGYLKHYPIIKTKLIEINETLINNISNNNNNNNLNPIDLLIAQQQKVITREILEYFSKNISAQSGRGRNNQFLKIPIVLRNGICQLDQFNYDVIRFGENFLFKCFIEMQSNNTISTTTTTTTSSHKKLQTLSIMNTMPVDTTTINFTKTCIDYQQQIYYYLINDLFNDDDETLTFEIDFNTKLNLFISEFGNPKNNLNYWHLIKIKNSQTPKYLLDQIYGESIDVDNEFICHNIILTIDYEFLYGHLKVDGVPNQLLLKEISLNFGTQLNLKFKYDNELMKIPIYLNVMFLDITSINNYAVTLSTSVSLRYYHLILLILLIYRINK